MYTVAAQLKPQSLTILLTFFQHGSVKKNTLNFAFLIRLLNLTRALNSAHLVCSKIFFRQQSCLPYGCHLGLSLNIFYPIFHCGLYCKAFNITNNLFNTNEGLGLLKLADTVLILINHSPSNVKNLTY